MDSSGALTAYASVPGTSRSSRARGVRRRRVPAGRLQELVPGQRPAQLRHRRHRRQLPDRRLTRGRRVPGHHRRLIHRHLTGAHRRHRRRQVRRPAGQPDNVRRPRRRQARVQDQPVLRRADPLPSPPLPRQRPRGQGDQVGVVPVQPSRHHRHLRLQAIDPPLTLNDHSGKAHALNRTCVRTRSQDLHKASSGVLQRNSSHRRHAAGAGWRRPCPSPPLHGWLPLRPYALVESWTISRLVVGARARACYQHQRRPLWRSLTPSRRFGLRRGRMSVRPERRRRRS
jgi:hypothetical protein